MSLRTIEESPVSASRNGEGAQTRPDRQSGGPRARGRQPAAPAVRGPWPWIAAVVALLVVAAAGTAFVLLRPATYSARVVVVVVPSGKVTAEQSAALFDSLSRGQVVATAAHIYEQPRWRPDFPGVTITAGNLTPSSVIEISARGSDREQVVRALTEVITRASPYVKDLLTPYEVRSLDTVDPTASPVGLARSTRLLLVALGSLLAAVLVGRIVARIIAWRG